MIINPIYAKFQITRHFHLRPRFVVREHTMARGLGIGRASPYVAIALGIISGNYIFNQPLKDHAAKRAKPSN